MGMDYCQCLPRKLGDGVVSKWLKPMVYDGEKRSSNRGIHTLRQTHLAKRQVVTLGVLMVRWVEEILHHLYNLRFANA
jgi:hypothetical protein